MKKLLIALVLTLASYSIAHAFEEGMKYVGVDSEGNSCSVERKGKTYYVNIKGNETILRSTSKSECSFYSNTPDQIVVRDLNWDGNGYAVQVTVNLTNGSFDLEEGPESFSRTRACKKFKKHRTIKTCYNLVSSEL